MEKTAFALFAAVFIRPPLQARETSLRLQPGDVEEQLIFRCWRTDSAEMSLAQRSPRNRHRGGDESQPGEASRQLKPLARRYVTNARHPNSENRRDTLHISQRRQQSVPGAITVTITCSQCKISDDKADPNEAISSEQLQQALPRLRRGLDEEIKPIVPGLRHGEPHRETRGPTLRGAPADLQDREEADRPYRAGRRYEAFINDRRPSLRLT